MRKKIPTRDKKKLTEIYRQATNVKNFAGQGNEILTDSRHVDPPPTKFRPSIITLLPN